MHLVIFGLTISSSWGNGHATLWRGLCRALHARGHHVTFFERDVPYYAQHRDLAHPEGCDLRLYQEWGDIRDDARGVLASADAAIVTSYCADGRQASALALESPAAIKAFYDLDTPVTLSRLRGGEPVDYLPANGLEDFDLALSYTGGQALLELRQTLGARAVAPLYGSVDPDVHRPMPSEPRLRSDLSYLGTYAADRQEALDRLFLQAAKRCPSGRFAIAGSQYPPEFPWLPNVFYFSHAAPADHPAFYCSSGLTLNVTRGPMAAMGHCPSGRLFEAAACGATIVSDWWEGLDGFFAPGDEILVASDTGDVLAALALSQEERTAVGTRARARALECHSSMARARDLEQILERVMNGGRPCLV